MGEMYCDCNHYMKPFVQVVVATIVSSYAMLESRFDVIVVGTIPKG